jgi:uncharacterized protein YjbI with pentapeptide repeats
MKRIAPFQIDIRDSIFEHGRVQYCSISATLCTHLLTGEVQLPFTYFEQIAEYQQEGINLDLGMPKPQGEFLVTGSFHAPGGAQITKSEVSITVGACQKKLLVFGKRQWQDGFASPPDFLTPVSLGYSSAYGGKQYAQNPIGMGCNDGVLPLLEHPDQRITRASQQPPPAAMGVIGLDWPQRNRFLGTYDSRYMQRSFPGHPADFDWHHFLAGAEDQRIKEFWQGNESFSLINMHPEYQLIEGRLPGLKPRCFLTHSLRSTDSVFGELPLQLDTLWFFPEKLLVLQIWRAVLEVNDDEASAIHHLLACYEDGRQVNREPQYYHQALKRRLENDDPLSNSLTTADLIPEGHQSAIELLQKTAYADSKPSALTANIAAREASLREQVDNQLAEAMAQAKEDIAKTDTPDQQPIDLDSFLDQAKKLPPDADQQELTNQLEAILPGITKGDAQAIDLKDFSFSKIDQIMEAVAAFSDKKEKVAKALAKEEIAKAKDNIQQQLLTEQNGLKNLPQEARQSLEEQLAQLVAIDLDTPPPSPLPRVRAGDILAQLDPIDPMIAEAMQHLQSLQEAGHVHTASNDLQEQIDALYGTRKAEMEERFHQAERDFKTAYILGAQFMPAGTSPHALPLDEVREQFFQVLARGESLNNRDWACIDLHGTELDGIDLSGCFLEQVDFRGTKLTKANLKGAILTRALLDNADLSEADLSEANVGAVSARGTIFRGADLTGAKLSRATLTEADFSKAKLEGVETLEFDISDAIFDQACLPRITCIRRHLRGTRFQDTAMTGAIFFECSLEETDFTRAILRQSVWADCALHNIRFDQADLGSACFVATEEGKTILSEVHFPGSCLERSTMQNLQLPHCNLSGAKLSGALFNGCDLSGANLMQAQALQTQFRKANLNGANLKCIDLREGSLAKAQLTNADFSRANLYAVDFLRCTLGKTDFTGANLDATILEQGDGQ